MTGGDLSGLTHLNPGCPSRLVPWAFLSTLGTGCVRGGCWRRSAGVQLGEVGAHGAGRDQASGGAPCLSGLKVGGRGTGLLLKPGSSGGQAARGGPVTPPGSRASRDTVGPALVCGPPAVGAAWPLGGRLARHGTGPLCGLCSRASSPPAAAAALQCCHPHASECPGGPPPPSGEGSGQLHLTLQTSNSGCTSRAWGPALGPPGRPLGRARHIPPGEACPGLGRLLAAGSSRGVGCWVPSRFSGSRRFGKRIASCCLWPCCPCQVRGHWLTSLGGAHSGGAGPGC